MKELKVWDPLSVKLQTYKTAIEVSMVCCAFKHEIDLTRSILLYRQLFYYCALMTLCQAAKSLKMQTNHNNLLPQMKPQPWIESRNKLSFIVMILHCCVVQAIKKLNYFTVNCTYTHKTCTRSCQIMPFSNGCIRSVQHVIPVTQSLSLYM